MKVKGSDKKSDPFIECKLMSAVEGSRTLIQVIGHEPESCAYANSATTAKVGIYQRKTLYLMLHIKSMY